MVCCFESFREYSLLFIRRLKRILSTIPLFLWSGVPLSSADMRKVGGTFGLLSRDQEEFVAVMGFLIAGVFMLVKPDNFMLPYLRIPAAGYKLSIARHGVRIARNKSILEQHGKRVAILLMRIFGAVFIMIPLLYLLF